MRRRLLVPASTAVALGMFAWAVRELDPRSVGLAFLVVWVPMTWLGTVSRVVQPRLPDRYHRLRDWELDGRCYELVGVRIAKRALRRGPLALFNPDLHLPTEHTPERVAHLDRRMRDAEASHAILFVATLGIVGNAVMHGWWSAAAWTLFFDVVMNGYPVMLQRYNRAGLRRRFATNAEPLTTHSS